MRKGISLIVLVITIIVIIILAGAVILSLANNNPIESANDAVLKQGVADAMEQLALAKVMAQRPGATLDYSAVQEIIDKGNLPIMLSGDKLELDESKDPSDREIVIITELLGVSSSGTVDLGGGTTVKADSQYDKPYIPVGFKYVEGTWDTGLVIEDVASTDAKKGNQFVWVPCDSTYNPYGRNGLGKTDVNLTGTPVSYKFNPHEDEDTILPKVNAVGGFYIARYEASNEDGIVVSKQNMEPWNNLTSLTAITKADGMYTTGDVRSTLVTGAMMDTAVTWLEKTKTTSGTRTDSTLWGNYNSSIYTLTNTSAKYAIHTSALGAYNNVTVGDSKTSSNKWLLTTGAHDDFSANKIYDLAGNVSEWTKEYYNTTDIAIRGGAYGWTGSSQPVSHRTNAGADFSSNSTGFRAALYIY